MFNQVDIRSIINSIPWFRDLPISSVDKLVNISKVRKVDQGEMIFQEGERIDDLYLVIAGKVSINIHFPNHGQIPIYEAEPLDIFGWSALTPIVRQRTANVWAIEDTYLIQFDGEKLSQHCEQDHDLGYVIMQRLTNVIASRLLTTRIQLFEIFLALPEVDNT